MAAEQLRLAVASYGEEVESWYERALDRPYFDPSREETERMDTRTEVAGAVARRIVGFSEPAPTARRHPIQRFRYWRAPE
jgi:hypothetical protein